MLPILENIFFFQRLGVEPWTLWGSCCSQGSFQRAAGLLAAHPLCSLPDMCWVLAWSCRADNKHVVASCRLLISFGSCQEMFVAYKEPTNNGSERSQGSEGALLSAGTWPALRRWEIV